MIINSVIRGNSGEGTITLESTMSSTDILLFPEDVTLDLAYSYNDSVYNEATVNFYTDGFLEDTQLPEIILNLDPTAGIWSDISDILLTIGTPGLHVFRISATNYNNETAFEDYRVLYDYDELLNMTIALNGDGNYTLTGYSNGLTEGYTLEILPYAYTDGVIRELTIIGPGVFLGDDYVESIILPETIIRIEDNAFNSASNLSSMTIYAETPPELGLNVFTNTESTLIVHVPTASLAAYQTAWDTPDNTYIEIQVIT